MTRGRFGGACAPFAPPWVRHCSPYANGAPMRAEFHYCFNNMYIRSDIS